MTAERVPSEQNILEAEKFWTSSVALESPAAAAAALRGGGGDGGGGVFRFWCAVPSCFYCLRLILLQSETGIGSSSGGWSSALCAAAALWEHFLTACCVCVCVCVCVCGGRQPTWRTAAPLHGLKDPEFSTRHHAIIQRHCHSVPPVSTFSHLMHIFFFSAFVCVSKIIDAVMYMKESPVFKGALCSFKEDILIRRARSSLADFFYALTN